MMRKCLLIILVCCLGCNENAENSKPGPLQQDLKKDSLTATEEKIPEKAFFCFFSTTNEVPSRDLRDSIILDLELKGEEVTGSFDWIPAEKDSRRGLIQATKKGDQVQGHYAFMQEGIQDTISIEIQLKGASAMITTLSDNAEEMIFEVERVDCL